MSYIAHINRSALNLPQSVEIPEIIWNALNCFDTVINETNSYPPYNIYSDTDDTHVIEIGVSGFSKDELDIVKEDQKLVVYGNPKKDESRKEFIHRKLAKRAFKQEFSLGKYIVVTGAEHDLGVLKITLRKEVPEDKKPQRIPILNHLVVEKPPDKVLLTE